MEHRKPTQPAEQLMPPLRRPPQNDCYYYSSLTQCVCRKTWNPNICIAGWTHDELFLLLPWFGTWKLTWNLRTAVLASEFIWFRLRVQCWFQHIAVIEELKIKISFWTSCAGLCWICAAFLLESAIGYRSTLCRVNPWKSYCFAKTIKWQLNNNGPEDPQGSVCVWTVWTYEQRTPAHCVWFFYMCAT